jgi:hypothetical protein
VHPRLAAKRGAAGRKNHGPAIICPRTFAPSRCQCTGQSPPYSVSHPA